MALWRRKNRKTEPYRAVTEEERISRYVYLLGSLPPSVIEHAHETAFAEMPADKRREMFDQLRPFMSDAERTQDAEPSLLARVLRRASAAGGSETATTTAVLERESTDAGRRPDERVGFLIQDPLLLSIVAYHFLASQSVVSYFAVGAGSLAVGGEPGWVGDIGSVGSAGYDTSGFDAGGAGGFDGGGGFGGGGFDGGGFGGGFDGGGFGGGGDGGGGG